MFLNLHFVSALWIGLVSQSCYSGQQEGERGNDNPFISKNVVWASGEDDIAAHFVYGLLVTKDGTILVASEARIHDGTDDGAHHLVLKRSTDMGDHFSDSQIIVESTDGQSWTNPTFLQDHESGTVFLFYAMNLENTKSRVFCIQSHDDGVTWSETTELTALFADNPHGWTFHLPGPGHGIQMTNGRLVVPVWHRKAITYPPLERGYGVNCLYSDDNGQTWTVGGDTPVGQFNESQIVEKANGELLFVGRTYSQKGGSWQAKTYSSDGAETWADSIEYDLGLTGRVCDIGLVRYSVNPTIILVSQPAHPKRREKLVLRVSYDEGLSWPVSKVVEAGPATYSDLAVLPNGDVVCLYGHGQSTYRNMPERVSLARFNLAWLTSPSGEEM